MTGAAPPTVKGSVLRARLAFVRERLGDAGVERLLAELSPEDRKIAGGIVLAGGWYPFALAERLDAAVARVTGLGDDAFRLMGRVSAQNNLSGVHRTFVREGDPHYLLRNTPGIYRTYYSTGHRTYESLGPRRAVLRTHDAETYSRHDCLTVVGWHERAIELCGGHDVRISERKCRARGDDVCEYECEWE